MRFRLYHNIDCIKPQYNRVSFWVYNIDESRYIGCMCNGVFYKRKCYSVLHKFPEIWREGSEYSLVELISEYPEILL